jgi:(p)ppGpp synthase/HD superfamily hydrolase
MTHKEMVYIKGFAKGKEYWNLLKAINVATTLHEGVKRKSGEPYIDHPMRVVSELIALGLHDDITLAAGLLHDVVEDTNTAANDLATKYNLDIEVARVVQLLSKESGMSTEFYYRHIREDIRAILVKLSDRCHNVSTMYGAFTIEKMQQYVEETETHVIPLCKYATRNHPEYSDQIFVLRYHIESVLKVIKGVIEMNKASDGMEYTEIGG